MRWKSRAGAELVEFAVVLPILMLLVFGIVDFSLALYDKAVVTNAAREGARAGIVFRTNPATGAVNRLTAAEIQAVATSYCGSYLVTFGSGTVSVSVTGAGGASGSPVSVTVTYPYNFAVISNFVPGLSDPTLTSTSVMRME